MSGLRPRKSPLAGRVKSIFRELRLRTCNDELGSHEAPHEGKKIPASKEFLIK